MSVSPALERTRHEYPRRRKSDTKPPSPYCYGLRHDNRLVKLRQRAHRRRFARSPRFQNRAGLKIVGAANNLSNTRCAPSRNDLIRTRGAQDFPGWRRRAPPRSRTRKQVFESPCRIAKAGCAVTIRMVRQKFFIKASSESRVSEFSKWLVSLCG